MGTQEGKSDLPQASEAILGSFAREERLARAIAIGVPAFVRRAKAVDESVAKLHGAIAVEKARRLKRLRAFIEKHGPQSRRAVEALERFNLEWIEYLRRVPIDEVHRTQEAYNRYYAIEREMALPGAPRAAVPAVKLLAREELVAAHAPLERD